MLFNRTAGFNALGQLRTEMDRLLTDVFTGNGGRIPRPDVQVFPALNVWEQGEDLFAEAELPGVRPEDVDVSVVANELVIKGRRKSMDESGVSFHRRERGVGEFTRTLRMPVDVDADKVEAKLCDGVLLVRLPKAAVAKPRKISVATG